MCATKKGRGYRAISKLQLVMQRPARVYTGNYNRPRSRAITEGSVRG
jgi:hypothetical protein